MNIAVVRREPPARVTPGAGTRTRVPLARNTATVESIVRRIKETDDKITSLPVAAFNSSI